MKIKKIIYHWTWIKIITKMSWHKNKLKRNEKKKLHSFKIMFGF